MIYCADLELDRAELTDEHIGNMPDDDFLLLAYGSSNSVRIITTASVKCDPLSLIMVRASFTSGGMRLKGCRRVSHHYRACVQAPGGLDGCASNSLLLSVSI